MKTGKFFELRFDKFQLRVPVGYWYAGYDTWVRLEGEEGIVGVTDFFQTKLGDIVYAAPAEGTFFEQDDVFATLESIKAMVDITIPATGELVSFNPALEEHPELIGEDPFGTGWIARLRLTDWEGDKLMLLPAKGYFELMEGKVAKEREG